MRDSRLATSRGEAVVSPLSGLTGAEVTGVDISQPSALKTSKPSAKHCCVGRSSSFATRPSTTQARSSSAASSVNSPTLTPTTTTPLRLPGDLRRGSTTRAIRYPTRRGHAHTEYHDSNDWHTDMTFLVNPPNGSILRADVVPPYGGDTMFTNLVAAYNALADPVQRLLESLRAEHFTGARYNLRERSKTFEANVGKTRLVAHHPVVRVHPRTGEKALFVNPGFTDRILDVSPLESRWILEFLFDHISRPSSPSDSNGHRAASPSGITVRLRISRRKISNKSTAASGCSIGSPSSARFL